MRNDLRRIAREIDQVTGYARRDEWVEHKLNNAEPKEIGEYLSAMSNSSEIFFRRCAGREPSNEPGPNDGLRGI